MAVLTNEGDILKGYKIICKARRVDGPQRLIKVEDTKRRELH